MATQRPAALSRLPPDARAAWLRFRRDLRQAADEHGIEVEVRVWNGIRNAWRDGYWTGREASPE